MTRTESLILLVNSLSKSEKRAFRIGRKETDYIVLFEMIDKAEHITPELLKRQYEKKRVGSSFSVAVNYLYKVLLDVLLTLRKNQDSYYSLFNRILKARVLFEKSIFTGALEMLDKVKREAVRSENYLALLYASRLELDYLVHLDTPNISETELAEKHFAIAEALKNIRIIYEQSSLYELLKHRIIYKGNVRSSRQKERMNDLVFSELSLAASRKNSFKARKRHLLFQSNYMMSTGDHRSASQTLHELHSLFEDNPQFWEDPPFYYVSVIEGILDNLRTMRHYDQIPYFIDRLRKIDHPSVRLQNHIAALIYLYELLPMLDRGDFTGAQKLFDRGEFISLPRKEQLNFSLRSEISLYSAILYLGLRDYKKAKKTLVNEIIFDNNIYALPIYRTIRLINLIVHYEMNDMDYVRMESRSLKREIAKAGKSHRVELLMLNLVGKDKLRLINRDKLKKLWLKIEPEITDIRNDVFERQLLKSFDFTAWIESKVCLIPLSECLRNSVLVAGYETVPV